MKYYRPKDRTDGLEIGITEVVKREVKLHYEEVYNRGYQDGVLDKRYGALNEQEPCDDAIGRQAVIEVLKDKWNMFSDANDAMQESIDTIEALSPVTPQQKTGHWIEERTYMECPKCHDIWHYEKNQTERFRCCPNCGVKMEVEE